MNWDTVEYLNTTLFRLFGKERLSDLNKTDPDTQKGKAGPTCRGFFPGTKNNSYFKLNNSYFFYDKNH